MPETTVIHMFDEADAPKLMQYSWTFNRTIGYMQSTKCPDKYIHRHLDIQTPERPTVDHISTWTTDHRRRNLRPLTQTEQNLNQNPQERAIDLPENCGFTVDDIPVNIYYRAATQHKGEHFQTKIWRYGVPTR